VCPGCALWFARLLIPCNPTVRRPRCSTPTVLFSPLPDIFFPPPLTLYSVRSMRSGEQSLALEALLLKMPIVQDHLRRRPSSVPALAEPSAAHPLCSSPSVSWPKPPPSSDLSLLLPPSSTSAPNFCPDSANSSLAPQIFLNPFALCRLSYLCWLRLFKVSELRHRKAASLMT